MKCSSREMSCYLDSCFTKIHDWNNFFARKPSTLCACVCARECRTWKEKWDVILKIHLSACITSTFCKRRTRARVEVSVAPLPLLQSPFLPLRGDRACALACVLAPVTALRASGKRFGVMAQPVGAETAVDSQQPATAHCSVDSFRAGHRPQCTRRAGKKRLYANVAVISLFVCVCDLLGGRDTWKVEPHIVT